MIQTELENLSLYFLDPESYCSIQQGIEKIRDHREKQIKRRRKSSLKEFNKPIW